MVGSGSVATLKLRNASRAKTITYLKELDWDQDKLIIGANGIAPLMFRGLPIASMPAAK